MSIAESVKLYLKNKPYILESLDSGVINYSALARVIKIRLRIRNEQAVKAAIMRYAEKREASKFGIEERALSVLKENRLTLLDGISVIVSDRKIAIENDAEVKIDSYYIYLTRKNILKEVKGKWKESIVKVHEGCSAIVIYSGAKLEGVSGVIAFVSSLLAEQGINMVELISCYTETIIVVNRQDALRSYQILSELTE